MGVHRLGGDTDRGCTPAIDHRRRFGRDVIGVREYQGHLVAVLAVDEKADGPSGRHRAGWRAGHLAGGGGRCRAAPVRCAP